MNHLGKTSDEVRRFGRTLINTYGEGEPSFEVAADDLLRDIHRYFNDDQGKPLFALIRTYRLCTYDELPADVLTSVDDSATKHWLALVATVGQENDWNDRLLSEEHRAIPAGSFSSPMLKAAFEQLNLRSQSPDRSFSASQHMVMLQEAISPTRYFYVEQALDNPFIPEQDDFVKPYGIESVMGIGCPFVSGSFHLTLFFSKVRLLQADVQLLMQLSPFISALLAVYDEQGRLWN